MGTPEKIFRFLMAGVVGMSVTQAERYFIEMNQWGLFWLTIMIIALGWSILITVWDYPKKKD